LPRGENPIRNNGADVAELVDARDLKSLDGNVVWVRVPPPAPISTVADSFKSLKIHIKYKKSPPIALNLPLFVNKLGYKLRYRAEIGNAEEGRTGPVFGPAEWDFVLLATRPQDACHDR
jgi:hypothetical protein